jgi:hypothetical protein
MQVKLPDGRVFCIPVRTSPIPKTSHPDKVQEYFQLTLELGLLFKNFLGAIKIPNRLRMLRTVKLMMITLKADNNLSKYADEILRFLVQQTFALSEAQAHEVFYGMVVNTKGLTDSHIPVDLQMEFIVRAMKKHIKHLFANKTQENITKQTGALAMFEDISFNYDKQTKVIVRGQKHATRSAHGEEVSMVEDILGVDPFKYHANRSFVNISNIAYSLLSSLNYDHFRGWLLRRAQIHAVSLGD